MNKTELIAAMAETSGLSKKDCDAALTAFITTIETALKSGEKVQLIGFGSFEVKERAARTGPQPPHQGDRGDPRIQGSRIQGGSGIQGRNSVMIDHGLGSFPRPCFLPYIGFLRKWHPVCLNVKGY